MRLPHFVLSRFVSLGLALNGWSIVSAAQPNILFIFSDDHRFDLLGSTNPRLQTPHLDALAESGVRFDRAFVTTAICSPSRAACLTGCYGSRNGVPTLSDPLKHPQSTFVHQLASAGYRTAQVGKWHLGTSPSDAGFSDYARIDSNGSWFRRPISSNIEGVPGNLDGRFYETVMADVVIRWIGHHVKESPDAPFMMWWCNQVPHVDGAMKYPDVKTDPDDKVVHRPHGSQGGYRAQYRLADMPVPDSWADDPAGWGKPGTKPGYLSSSRFVKKSASANYGGPGGYTNPGRGKRNRTKGEDHVQQHMLEYYASVSALDAEIGRVVASLGDPNGDGDRSDSILDNTWIVFMGDNGWQTGHHRFTSKVLAYEESCRVPLIIRAPGVPARTEEKLTLNIDLAPMFLDLAGLAPPEFMQGNNLRDLVENPASDWRDAIYYEAVTPEKSLGARPHDAIRTARFKLIHTYDSAGSEVEFVELYDLEQDPAEMKNLAANPDLARTRAALAAELKRLKAKVAESPDPAP